MPDTVSKKKRSEIMSRVRSKNTKPELRVRSALHSRGLRYRLNYDLCLLADRGNGIGEGTPGCVVQPEPEPLPVPGVDEAPVADPTSPTPAPSVPVPSGADGGYNCSDFGSQAQAQEYMQPGDPDGLDANDDGQACEDSF